jgi:outer membrane murein-binding lipoprotein Lpp
MKIAEHSSTVKIKLDPFSSGALPHKIGSFYNEILIVNNLCEKLYAIGSNNKPVLIEPNPIYQSSYNRYVEIRSRLCVGQQSVKRTYNQMGGLENTPINHETMQISYEDLRDEPHFVEELNAVLCFHDQISIAKHPHSEEAIADRVRKIRLEVYQARADTPFVLVANDPTHKINSLFIAIEGRICAVRVTHIADEPDDVLLAFRDKEHSPDEFTRYRSTFTELLTQDPHVWMLGGLRLSTSRSWLKNVLETEKNQKPDMIEAVAVGSMIKQARSEDTAKINALTEEKRELTQRFKALESKHNALVSGDYHERAAALAQEKLEVERIKLQQAAVEAKLALTGERIKFHKELIASVGIVAKTMAVVVPIGIGIYKLVKAARAVT